MKLNCRMKQRRSAPPHGFEQDWAPSSSQLRSANRIAQLEIVTVVSDGSFAKLAAIRRASFFVNSLTAVIPTMKQRVFLRPAKAAVTVRQQLYF
jgi:hypothetical protein